MSVNTRLFVSNLPVDINEKELVSAFSAYGEVTNLDLKCKTESDTNPKKFAFVTLAANGYDVESCIKYFSNEEFKGYKLYVTRARESFLERLQREREQANQKTAEKNTFPEQTTEKSVPTIELSEKLNPRKRQIDHKSINNVPTVSKINRNNNFMDDAFADSNKDMILKDDKKYASERKRLQSMNKKRQEFKEKQNIIKSGLISIDKVRNKKIIFSDNEEQIPPTKLYHIDNVEQNKNRGKKTILFEDDASDNDDITFEIKQQFEGKKGQKVLSLQSRYKSDKRFTLDERFIEDDDDANSEASEEKSKENDVVDVSQADEKSKQLDILQNVLGIQIKQTVKDPNKENKKAKLGMLRFDPTQPEHAKFLVQTQDVEQKTNKKQKKKKAKEIDEKPIEPIHVEKVEVSKEQYFKVSENLKEAITQPSEFSLRSLFSKTDNTVEETETKKREDYVTQEPLAKKAKIKNPLTPGENNPFVYDSSDSDTEEAQNKEIVKIPNELQAVWKENLFFSISDIRLKEGLMFFNKSNLNEGRKERRELKSLMKKRIHNTERKNQMFQKKIGGRRKSMKKSFMKHGMNKKNK